jgi:phage tail tape-measure protein
MRNGYARRFMMKLWHGLAMAGLMVSLAACGETTGDRALSGAAIGAGSGAAIGAVAGPVGVGTGAAIGAGVGAATGAVTSPSQVDLGRPVWDR